MTMRLPALRGGAAGARSVRCFALAGYARADDHAAAASGSGDACQPEGRSARRPATPAEPASAAAGLDHQAGARSSRPDARLQRDRRLDPACSTTRASRWPISRSPPIELDGADRTTRAGHVPVQRRARCVLGVAPVRQCRAVAAAARTPRLRSPSASPEVKPNAETWLDFTDLVFIDPVGTGYSRFVASGEDARKRFYSADGDVNVDRAGDPPLAGEARPAGLAEIRHGRELWRHSRSEGRAPAAASAWRRRQGLDPGLAAVRLPRVHGLQPPAICRAAAELCRGGARCEGGEGTGRRAPISPTSRLTRAANFWATSSRAKPTRKRPPASPTRSPRSPASTGGEPPARRTLRRR